MLSTMIGRTVHVKVTVPNFKAKDPNWRPARGENYYIPGRIIGEVVTVYQTSSGIRYQVLEADTGKLHDVATDHVTVPPRVLPDPYRDMLPPQAHGPGGVRF